MNLNLDTLFPEELSDETVCAIAEVLNDLANQWESRHFHRIRVYQAQQQVDLFDVEESWRRKVPE